MPFLRDAGLGERWKLLVRAEPITGGMGSFAIDPSRS
jgi:hypothetical protein